MYRPRQRNVLKKGLSTDEKTQPELPNVMCVENRPKEGEAAQLNAASMESDYWTMDSACSYHYTFHREWFTTFEAEAVSGDSVSLGDNSSCTVLGVGTVILKTPPASSAA